MGGVNDHVYVIGIERVLLLPDLARLGRSRARARVLRIFQHNVIIVPVVPRRPRWPARVNRYRVGEDYTL